MIINLSMFLILDLMSEAGPNHHASSEPADPLRRSVETQKFLLCHSLALL